MKTFRALQKVWQRLNQHLNDCLNRSKLMYPWKEIELSKIQKSKTFLFKQNQGENRLASRQKKLLQYQILPYQEIDKFFVITFLKFFDLAIQKFPI